MGRASSGWQGVSAYKGYSPTVYRQLCATAPVYMSTQATQCMGLRSTRAARVHSESLATPIEPMPPVIEILLKSAIPPHLGYRAKNRHLCATLNTHDNCALPMDVQG